MRNLPAKRSMVWPGRGRLVTQLEVAVDDRIDILL
jgi:hypothetical protein